jgi:glycosidase
LFLYGTPFLYNGEEIGMSNATYPDAEDYFTDVGTKNDVMACRKQGYSEEQILSYLHRCSRVNARTPMQWNRDPNAGFLDREAHQRRQPELSRGGQRPR